MPNGFSTTSRRHAPFFGQHAGAAEFPADRPKRVRRRRQIEQAIAAVFPVASSSSSCLRSASNEAGSLGIGLDAGTHASRRCATRRRPGGSANWRRPFIRLSRKFVAATCPCGRRRPRRICPAAGRSPQDCRARERPAGAQVAGDAEDHEGAGIGLLCCALRRDHAIRPRLTFALCRAGSDAAAVPYGRRNRRASRTGSFRRRCAPCASGSAHTAPRSAPRPAPPRRSRR